jgi:glucose-1-phosphate adenylyltransferase
VSNAILDKNAKVPEGAAIGYDLDNDRKQHHVSESGIVVVEGDSSAVEVTVLQLDNPKERRRRKTDASDF